MSLATRITGWLRLLVVVPLLLCGPAAAGAGTVSFIYDPQGRLANAIYPDGTLIVYTYDAAGNRLSYSYPGCPLRWNSFNWSATTWCLGSAPIANPLSVIVYKNTVSVPIPLNISNGTATGVSVTTAPTDGVATATGTSINYTPSANFTGSDAFQYTAINASGGSSPATVTITVATFSPVTHTYASGSGTETVPYGALSVTITADGGGGGGGDGDCSVHFGGGGGGSGRAVLTKPAAGGQTLAYVVGGSGLPTTVTGTLSGGYSVRIDAGAGGGGANPTGGAGGTASGGTTDTSGAAGSAGGIGQAGSGGAAANGAAAGTPPGSGGNGGFCSSTPGAAGQLTFAYS